MTLTEPAHAGFNPKERIDFWNKHYTELLPQHDKRVTQARSIFKRIADVAGSRPGVEPRLHIIRENPFNLSLPIALPSGWVIISKEVLDFCLRDQRSGEHLLAFVLAHEIAHLLEDDFWHMKFFQAMSSYEKTGAPDSVTTQVRAIAKETDKILAKELRADEQGIVYMMMAGFDAGKVADPANVGETDFFTRWITHLNPKRFTKMSPFHPNPKQRATVVRARLQQVKRQSDLFNLGLFLYLSGEYQPAVIAFDDFRREYPGREVHHNLAASHHQLAMQYYRPPHSNADKNLPFRLSVHIDPIIRISQVNRTAGGVTARFKHHMAKAIAYYKLAIRQDHNYLPSYNNLACAYILNNEPYKAIALLQDAVKIHHGDGGLLNNLGVAFYKAENKTKALSYFKRASTANNVNQIILFNLGNFASRQGRDKDAKLYWMNYLQQFPTGPWSRLIRARLNMPMRIARDKVSAPAETLHGLMVGRYQNELPKSWKSLQEQTFTVGKTTYVINRYSNGILTIREQDEFRILVTQPEYPGITAKGIKQGDTRARIVQNYGHPLQSLSTPRGEILIYPNHGINFTMINNHLRSWMLYWE